MWYIYVCVCICLLLLLPICDYACLYCHPATSMTVAAVFFSSAFSAYSLGALAVGISILYTLMFVIQCYKDIDVLGGGRFELCYAVRAHTQ